MSGFEAVDYTTPAGIKLREILEARLVVLRGRNEDVNMPDRDSLITRARIDELKSLLAKPMVVVPLPTYNLKGRGML